MIPMNELKEIDKKLLNMVQEEWACVPRVSQIAHKLGLPISTVKTKLDKFRKEGIIKGYAGILDGTKVGRGLVAFKLAGKKFKKTTELDEFGEKLAEISEVQEVHFLVGEWDYLVKMRVKDEAEYTKVAPKIAIMMDGCKGIISPKTFKDTHKILVK
jgi:Lrp/AsnC family leucine-responsive transcriptional regulator